MQKLRNPSPRVERMNRNALSLMRDITNFTQYDMFHMNGPEIDNLASAAQDLKQLVKYCREEKQRMKKEIEQ